MTEPKIKPHNGIPAAVAKKAAAPRRRSPAAAAAVPAPPASMQMPVADMKKVKRVQASFSMSEAQFSSLAELKARCLQFGVTVKKGELVAAGLQLLMGLQETSLEAVVLPNLRADRGAVNGKKRKQ